MEALPTFYDVRTLNLLFSKKGCNQRFKLKISTGCMTRGREPVIAGDASANSLPQNINLPPIRPKYKKKPFVAPPRRVLKKGLKKPPLEDSYSPPGNGLLVPEMIPVAQAVFEARETLLKLVAMLMDVVPVKACKFCDHTHVGPIGHDIATCEGRGSSLRYGRHDWTNGCVHDVVSNLDVYHSYDRFNIIRHDDSRRALKRLPAVVELCIQAGLDLPEYPVVRRIRPVRVDGRRKVELDNMYFPLPADLDLIDEDDFYGDASTKAPSFTSSLLVRPRFSSRSKLRTDGKINSDWKFDEVLDAGDLLTQQCFEDTKQIAEICLRLWDVMRSGAERLMSKYTVRVCGYCPEVHVGPRGHLIRLCGAFKHQWRQGKHGWQVANLDDLIPPKYVWHVPNLKNPLLFNDLRNFYGQAPALVELCAQAGAEVPEKYRPMMRLDVVEPTGYEADHAV